jgi:hypothetical protein
MCIHCLGHSPPPCLPPEAFLILTPNKHIYEGKRPKIIIFVNKNRNLNFISLGLITCFTLIVFTLKVGF